jgi:hypothetical protein
VGKCGHGEGNAAHGRGRRRSPEGGTAVFGEESHGDGCGVQGEGRGRKIVFYHRGTRLIWRELCPCLNPLGSTGKRPVGPERSAAALRPFDLFDFFRGGTGAFTPLFLLALPCEITGKKSAIGVKNRAFLLGVGE